MAKKVYTFGPFKHQFLLKYVNLGHITFLHATKMSQDKKSKFAIIQEKLYYFIVLALSPMYSVLMKMEPKLRPHLVEKTGLSWHKWAYGVILILTVCLYAQTVKIYL